MNNMSETSYKSQWSQDKYVNETFFKNKKYGIFCDIGAHNGISGSNSYFFEKELNWSGICIEPNIDVYPDLIKNRNCICINKGVYNKTGTTTFRKLKGYCQCLSGIIDTYNPKHIDRINNELGQTGGEYEDIMIETIKLEDLFDKYGMTHIDYLSIDTEGSELQILEGINFNKVSINIIDVEMNYPEEEKQINQFLIEKGYRFNCKLEGDSIFQMI